MTSFPSSERAEARRRDTERYYAMQLEAAGRIVVPRRASAWWLVAIAVATGIIADVVGAP